MRLLSPAGARPLVTAEAARKLTRAGQAAVLATAVTLYVLVMLQAAGRHQDLDTYLRAGRDLLAGRPLYAPFLTHPFPDPTLRPAFIYPPVFALLIAPLTLVPGGAAAVIWLVAMQACVAGAFGLTWRVLRPPAWAVVLMAAITLTFYPLWVDAIQGQVNGLVLVLTIAGMGAIICRRPAGGLAIGAAIALKLTPALLLIWLVVERRFSALAWSVGGFAALTGLGAAMRPADSVSFFSRVLPQLARGTAYYNNQSVGGLLGRLFTANAYTTPVIRVAFEPALVIIVSLGLVAYWITRRAALDPWPAAMAFLPLLPLASSVTWEHHLVIVAPVLWAALAAIAQQNWPPLKVAVLALLVAGFSLLPHWTAGPGFGQPGFRAAQTSDPLVILAANGLFLATLALLLAAPWLLRAR